MCESGHQIGLMVVVRLVSSEAAAIPLPGDTLAEPGLFH